MRYAKPTLLLPLLLLAGCANQPSNHGIVRKPYYGPTDPMSVVVEQINANSQKIPSLWADLYYEATIIDEKGKSAFINGDGNLLYQAPISVRLLGRKDLVGTVFEVGSNPELFWVKLLPQLDTLWIGEWSNASQQALERKHIPFRPDMLLQVLGVETIDTNFNELPVPTMRFNNDVDVYMFVWNARVPDRWYAQREVWYDRKTKLPLFVFLFDNDGRVVLRAQLSQYRQVRSPGLAEKEWPSIAGDYKLFFPDTGSRMEFTLRDAAISMKGPGNITVPNPRSFTAPDVEKPGVGHVIEIR